MLGERFINMGNNWQNLLTEFVGKKLNTSIRGKISENNLAYTTILKCYSVLMTTLRTMYYTIKMNKL